MNIRQLPAPSSPSSSPTVSAWRTWAASAAPDLLEDFDRRSLDTLRRVRRAYPADCGPRHPGYGQMRQACIEALENLAIHVQEEHDA